LRFSLCYHNTEKEVDRAVQILETVVQRLRKLSKRVCA
jgi:cysteine sulfinate desulfinase/cysteine desulfurase-like protein